MSECTFNENSCFKMLHILNILLLENITNLYIKVSVEFWAWQLPNNYDYYASQPSPVSSRRPSSGASQQPPVSPPPPTLAAPPSPKMSPTTLSAPELIPAVPPELVSVIV